MLFVVSVFNICSSHYYIIFWECIEQFKGTQKSTWHTARAKKNLISKRQLQFLRERERCIVLFIEHMDPFYKTHYLSLHFTRVLIGGIWESRWLTSDPIPNIAFASWPKGFPNNFTPDQGKVSDLSPYLLHWRLIKNYLLNMYEVWASEPLDHSHANKKGTGREDSPFSLAEWMDRGKRQGLSVLWGKIGVEICEKADFTIVRVHAEEFFLACLDNNFCYMYFLSLTSQFGLRGLVGNFRRTGRFNVHRYVCIYFVK